MIKTQDLKVLFRAQDTLCRLAAGDFTAVPCLEPAIALARDRLEASKGRRRYLMEMLPASVAYALPGLHGGFVIHFPEAGCIELHQGIPVLLQILRLEQHRGESAVRLVHDSGVGGREQEYRL